MMVGHGLQGAAFSLGQLAVALAAALALSVVLHWWRRMLCYSLCPVAFLLGAAMFHEAESSVENPFPDTYAYYKAIVTDEPSVGERRVRVDVTMVSAPYEGVRARLYLQKGKDVSTLALGDGLSFKARLQAPKPLANSNFDYPLYLKGRGIVATGYVPQGKYKKAEASPDGLSLVARARLAALRYRHRLVESYGQLGLAGDALAVASAMTLGDKSSIDDGLRRVYATTGTSHILALSGMHLGIVYALLLFFSMGRAHSSWRILVLMLAVWAFAWLVGLSPSVVRAAVMLSVYSLMVAAARDATSVNTLAFTAMAMLAVSPLSLFDIGFQLSFVAVGAIIMFNGGISGLLSHEWLQRHAVVRYFWQVGTMSTVAQVATLPLTIYYFGQVSLCFLVANFVVIPAATVIIYAAVGVFAVGFFPPLQQALATVMGLVATALNLALQQLATLPMASVTGLHIATWQYAALQLFCFALLWLAAVAVRMYKYQRDLS